jgi:hypothetical protein
LPAKADVEFPGLIAWFAAPDRDDGHIVGLFRRACESVGRFQEPIDHLLGR